MVFRYMALYNMNKFLSHLSRQSDPVLPITTQTVVIKLCWKDHLRDTLGGSDDYQNRNEVILENKNPIIRNLGNIAQDLPKFGEHITWIIQNELL